MRKHKGLAFDLPTSMHQHVAGQTLNYYPSDTKEARTYTKTIEYRFNNQGFRADHNMTEYEGLQYDKTQGPVNMFLGCSNTLGIGVNLEETWCWHVNNSVGGVMLNLGQAGGSQETAYRIARHWIAIIRPRSVYMLSPPAVRREFWMNDDTPTIIGPRSSMYREHMVSEREIQLNRERVVDAIHYHCVKHDCTFKYVHFRPIVDAWGPFPDLARDGSHPGPKSHKEIAQYFK